MKIWKWNKIQHLLFFLYNCVFSEAQSSISALPDTIKTDSVFPISKIFHGLCLRSENLIHDVKYPRTASVLEKQMLHIFTTFGICLVDSRECDGFGVKINPLHCQIEITIMIFLKKHLWFSCEQGEQGALTLQEFSMAIHDTGSYVRLYY